MMELGVLTLPVALFYSGLFGLAFLHKVINYRAFKATIRGQRVLSGQLETLASAGVLIIEASLCLGFVFLSDLSWIWLSAAGLLSLYAGILWRSLKYGYAYSGCGCSWGSSEQPTQPWMIARNLLLAFIALVFSAHNHPIEVTFFTLINAVLFAVAALSAYLGIDLAQQSRWRGFTIGGR